MGLKELFQNLQNNKMSKQLQSNVIEMLNSPNANRMTLEQLEQLANPRKPKPLDPIRILLPPIVD